MTAAPVVVFAAFDAERRGRGLGWCEFADELWEQSAELNAERSDHPLCGGAVSRLGTRGAASCQYALYMLRWLGRAPEEFLAGPARHVGEVELPEPGPGSRLRWDLNGSRGRHGTAVARSGEGPVVRQAPALPDYLT